MRATKFTLLILFIFSTVALQALSSDQRSEIFDRASTAYANNDFSGALKLFRQIEESGIVSSDLYFNIGNAYYRLNNPGHAVLYWERAARLAPGDQNIEHNLRLASLKMKDKVVLPEGFSFFEWYWNLRRSVSIEILLFLSGLFLFMLISVLLLPKSRLLNDSLRAKLSRVLRYPAIFILLFLILFSLMSLDKYRYDRDNRFAIVTAREIRVTGEPRPAANVLFLLHAGSKVKILNKLDDWVEISYFDDKVGWTAAENIEAVIQDEEEMK